MSQPIIDDFEHKNTPTPGIAAEIQKLQDLEQEVRAADQTILASLHKKCDALEQLNQKKEALLTAANMNLRMQLEQLKLQKE